MSEIYNNLLRSHESKLVTRFGWTKKYRNNTKRRSNLCRIIRKIELIILPTTVGSKSTKTALGTCFPAPVSLKKVLNESSPPPMVLSLGIWPSGWIPCSKQYSSQHPLPIWTPAWPTWTEIHSRYDKNEKKVFSLTVFNRKKKCCINDCHCVLRTIFEVVKLNGKHRNNRNYTILAFDSDFYLNEKVSVDFLRLWRYNVRLQHKSISKWSLEMTRTIHDKWRAPKFFKTRLTKPVFLVLKQVSMS